MQAEALDLVNDLLEDRHQVAVAEREYGIEMHGGAALRHQAADDPARALVPEQLASDLADALIGRTLAHPDQHHALADWHHVAAFHRGTREILVGIAPPDPESPTLELRMVPIDRPLKQSLGFARWPIHW